MAEEEGFGGRAIEGWGSGGRGVGAGEGGLGDQVRQRAQAFFCFFFVCFWGGGIYFGFSFSLG